MSLSGLYPIELKEESAIAKNYKSTDEYHA